MMDLYKDLIDNEDLAYKEFIYRLIPGIDKERIVGVRKPVIKLIAKKYKNIDFEELLIELDRQNMYLEEVLVFIEILNNWKNYEQSISITNKLLKHMDNWLLTDALRPKLWKNNRTELKSQAFLWLSSDVIYEKRFAIGVFMSYFLGEYLDELATDKIASIKTDEYYLIMMISWYMAELIVKNREVFYRYFPKLQDTIARQTIQKAIESRRVSDKDKLILRKMRALI